MNPLIFREYDIRGVADRDLHDDVVENIGRALGTLLRRGDRRRIAIGRDCRLSSPRLHAALSRGLRSAGIALVDIGVGPTPAMYFTVFHLDLDGGVQITGSHNPPGDNGFKMMVGKSTMAGEEIRALRELIETGDYVQSAEEAVEEFDPLPAYRGFVQGNIRLGPRALRIAVDAGNGAGGPLALAALAAVGVEPVAMYCEMDGHFPNHHPDPSQPENIAALTERVLQDGLDLGIAYDGDADRIGVIDDKGAVLWGDRLMILLSRHILQRHPGAGIIGEVKCSQTLYDDIAAHGGRPIIWKTGHSLIKRKLKEEKALLAGEMSGHIFFADRFFGFDDAVYATLRLLEILSQTDAPLSELLRDVPTTHVTPELRVECADDEKFGIVQRVLSHYRERNEVLDVDGARIQFPGGWGLVRASNTQPVLVLRFEADSQARLDEIRAEVEGVVEQAKRPAAEQDQT